MGPSPHAGRPSVSPTEDELRILRLLASGVTDETAALRLGWNSRTLRRRLQSAMAKLGAVSRFQAGYLAALAGWVTPESDAEHERDAGSGHSFVQMHKGSHTPDTEREPHGRTT